MIEFFDPIDTYLARHMIAITPSQRAALVTYLETLREWNEMLNLTAIKDPAQMVTKHVLDALTYLPFWATPPKRMIDVGTGAGIPGIILAIMWPSTHVTLAESIAKKCKFLVHVAEKLELKNVHIIAERAEVIGHNWDYRGQYDLSTARAVAEARWKTPNPDSQRAYIEVCYPLYNRRGTRDPDAALRSNRMRARWKHFSKNRNNKC